MLSKPSWILFLLTIQIFKDDETDIVGERDFPTRGGETPHMKGVGMLVVSLRAVNFGFWSHLGVLGKTPSYLAVKVSFRVAHEKI